MKDIDLKLLRSLIAIEEAGSFERAAERVLRTQAALSQQMARLEAQLGIKIFHKVGRRNEITAAGRHLVDYARRLVIVHDEMVRSVVQGERLSTIRLGVSGDVVDDLLPQLLKEVVRHHPEIMTDMQIGGGPKLMTALKDGQLDLAISSRTDRSMSHIALRTLDVIWIASDDFRLTGPVVPLVLTREPSLFRRLAIEGLERQGRLWEERHQSPTLSAVRAAVAAGAGITARTRSMLRPGLRELDESCGLGPLGRMTLYLTQSPVAANRSVFSFFNCIRNMVVQRPDWA